MGTEEIVTHMSPQLRCVTQARPLPVSPAEQLPRGARPITQTLPPQTRTSRSHLDPSAQNKKLRSDLNKGSPQNKTTSLQSQNDSRTCRSNTSVCLLKGVLEN